MAATDHAPVKRSGKSLLPPEERFWKRYSPHFELPVAGATALFAHGVIVGILLVGGLAFLFRASAEASRPAKMDTVFVDKRAQFPNEMGGAPAGEPGLPGEPGRTDMGQDPPGDPGGDSNDPEEGGDNLPALPTLPMVSLDVPATAPQADASAVERQLQAINKTAEERSKVPPAPRPRPKRVGGTKKKSTRAGTGNPRGVGGRAGRAASASAARVPVAAAAAWATRRATRRSRRGAGSST